MMPKLSKTAQLPYCSLVIVLLAGALLSGCHSAPTESAAPGAQLATPSATTDSACAGITDEAIMKEIAGKIRSDAQFQGQLNHIAVNSKGGLVTLLGWAKGEAAVAAIGRYAQGTKCVAKVENLMNSKLTVGCGNDEENCPNVGCVPLGKCTTAVGEIGASSNSMPMLSSMAEPVSSPSPSPSPATSPSPSPTVKRRR